MGKNLKAENMYGIKICYFKIFMLVTEYCELILICMLWLSVLIINLTSSRITLEEGLN